MIEKDLPDCIFLCSHLMYSLGQAETENISHLEQSGTTQLLILTEHKISPD